MSYPKQSTYVLDTNILINFGLFVPIKLNKPFWDKMEEMLILGKWVLLDVVVAEIKYNEDLKKWCKSQSESGRIVAIDDLHRLRAVEINNTYRMIDETTQKSEADTYIIAFAEDKKLKIFTREGTKDPTDKNALYKIPDVCKILKIPYERLPERFLEELGF